MKKRLLIIMSFSLFVVVNTFAQSLIKDGNFDSEVFVKGPGDPGIEDRGKWYFKTYNGMDANIVDEGEDRGKVVRIERHESTASSWFNSFLSQWNEEKAEKIKYRLTFKAKKEDGNGKIRLHMYSKKGGNRFFVLKGKEFFNGYAAHTEFTLTEQWETYTVEYDFKYIVKNLYQAKEDEYEEATEEDLDNFYFVLYPTTNNTTVLIDDVSLIPINVELVQDGGFDSGFLMRGADNPNQVAEARGFWYYRTHSNTTAAIVNTGDFQGNAVMIERGYGEDISFYRSFISQWIDGNATKGQYRLKFKAKGEFKPENEESEIRTPQMRVLMRTEDKNVTQNKDRFFVLQGKALTAGYAAHRDFSLTDEWQTFYVDYDFNYVVNTIYQVSADNIETAYTESTNEQLMDFFFTFHPHLNGTTIFVDDVSLIPFVRNSGTNKDIVLDGSWDLNTFNDIISMCETTSITSIDFTNVEGITILPTIENLNPNCLFYVSPGVTGEGYNLVTVTEEGASASTITLSEGDYFNNTRAFNAGAVSYKRDFTDMPFASLLLPFVPENIDDIVLEEFKEVKVEGETTTAIFEITENITANTPYIVKLGGNVGEKTFTASDVEIAATPAEISSGVSNGYVLKGNYQLIEREEAIGLYLLRTDGTKFAVGTIESLVPAFRSYLEYVGEDAPAKSIGVEHGNDDGPTSIDIESPEKIFEIISKRGEVEIYTTESQVVSLYALDGRILQRLILEPGYNTVSNLSKGTYLINNQKVVVR